jgi:ribokinase
MIAVIGYTAVDHPMMVSDLPAPGAGALVTARLATPWPRVGGSGANVARAAAAVRGSTELVSWLGDDPDGVRALAELDHAGVGVGGIQIRPGRTASSWIFYDPRGTAVSFLDPGYPAPRNLSAAQRDRLSTAGWVCFTAAPPDATGAALDRLGTRTRVAWVVKADRMCFPPPLVARLVRRASVIVLNAAERSFLGADDVPTDLLVVTDGSGPIRYRTNGRWTRELVDPILTEDVTGAGDTFAGALVAHLAASRRTEASPAVAVAREAARSFLFARTR